MVKKEKKRVKAKKGETRGNQTSEKKKIIADVRSKERKGGELEIALPSLEKSE